MSNVTTTPKGTTVDLDTTRGCYVYVSEYLVSKGADSKTFSCLEKMYLKCKEEKK